MYDSTGTEKRPWDRIIQISSDITSNYNETFTISPGMYPVAAGDYLEFELDHHSAQANARLRYKLAADTSQFKKAIEVFLYENVTAATRGSHTDNQIKDIVGDLVTTAAKVGITASYNNTTKQLSFTKNKPDWNAAAGTAAEILNKPTIPLI